MTSPESTRAAEAHPKEVITLDDVAAQLRDWRRAAGSPSFSEISRRIAAERAARADHPRHRTPGRMTVYDCFSDGRKRLNVQLVVDIAEVLGVHGEALERWRQQCLSAQGRRALPHSVTAHRGLPPRPGVFVGRENERARCLSSTVPVIIEGMAGTGKTELAFQCVAELLTSTAISEVVVVALGATRAPDDTASAQAISEAVLRALDRSVRATANEDELAAEIGILLAELDVAIILDDVTEAEQVSALLSANFTTPVFVTTRSRLELKDTTRVSLSTWSREESMELIRRVVGRGRVAEEEASAEKIAHLVDGLPLAVTLTAARMHQQDSWSLADHAHALQQRLDSQHLDAPVSASISLTYAALSDSAQRAFRLIATQPCQTIAPSAVRALLGLPDESAEAVLSELDRAHAILRVQRDRISLHSLMRTYGTARSWEEDRPTQREEGVDNMARSVIDQAWACAERLYPGIATSFGIERVLHQPASAEEAADQLEEELDSLVELAVARAASNAGTTVEIAQALSRHFDNRGRWPLALSMHRAAADAARNAEDTVGEAYAELGIGTTSVRLGMPDAVHHLERARDLAVLSGVRRPAYSATNALAILAAQAGEPIVALARFRESLALAREDGADALVQLVTDNIAVVLRRLGDLDGALTHHQQSLAAAEASDSRNGIATSLGNMSEVLLLLGRVDEAVDAAERGREIARGISSTVTYAYATANLGLAIDARGDHIEALSLTNEALRSARENSIRALEISCVNNLGYLLLDDDPAAAEVHLREALALSFELDMADERSRSLHGLGQLALDRHEFAVANDHLREALRLLGSEDVPEAGQIRSLLDRITAEG